MRKELLNWISKVVYHHYITVFTICLILTVVFGVFASKITMEMTWGSLIPDGQPSKETFNTVISDFGSATQIVIAIDGNNKEQIISASEELVPLLRELKVDIKTAESDPPEIINAAKTVLSQYDTEFLSKHGMMLIKAKDLKKQGLIYTDYNLVSFLKHSNDLMESEYVQNSDNLTKQEKEAVRALDGTYEFVESLRIFAEGNSEDHGIVSSAVDALTLGDGYYLSNDKKMLLIFMSPTISLNVPIDVTVKVVNAIDKVLAEFGKQNPSLKVSMTGGHVITRDEMEAGMEDTARNLSMAFIIILIVFIISFRMWSGPLLAMLVLVSGITWDIGLAYLIFGRLNIMTAMCSVVLIGLGVDFSIHILSAYSEFRHKGMNTEKAFAETFATIGTGLFTGAVTTSCAFFALVFTSYSAYREFGLVVGLGILSCLAVSVFFLPSVIVMKEKIWKNFKGREDLKQVDMEFKFLGTIAEKTSKYAWVTVAVFVLLLGASYMYVDDIYMNRNYMDMEPEGLESVRLQREIPKRFNMSPDNMMAIANSLEEANIITDKLNERPAIGFVESLTDYLPSSEKQNARMPEVQKIFDSQKNLPRARTIEIEELKEELFRFSDNLTEMSSLAYISGLDKVFDKTNQFLGLDEEGEQIATNKVLEVIDAIEKNGNSLSGLQAYQKDFIPAMKDRITGMSNPELITLESVPKDIRDRFISNDGSKYLISIYSKSDIWDGLFTTPFMETVLQDAPEASGMPVLMKAMIMTAKDEGGKAILYAFIAFILILFIDFRSAKITIIAAIPLVSAFILMLGIMGFTGTPFTVVNVIGLPLILGIGIDDAVHIIHRYRIEGAARLSYSVASIGKAIFLTTLTTILGFGSLISSSYRGYASLGLLVTLGVTLCFVTSVLILPPILKLALRDND